MIKLLDAQLLTSGFVPTDSKINSRGGAVLYVDYAKGDETNMVLALEFSPDGDTEGSETWCSETDVNNAGLVSVKEYTFSATGKYRLPVPAGAGDDKIRVKVKATAGTPTGTVTIFAKT